MSEWSRIRSLWRNVAHRGRVERELDAEIDSYMEHLVAEKMSAGQSPDAARRAAMIELGGSDHVKEEVRDVRTGAGLDRLLADARYAIRGLIRNPGFATTAILALSLGIAITTSVFSLVHGVLLRPLPYPEPHELQRVWMSNPRQGIEKDVASYPQFGAWRERSRSFEYMAGVRPMTMNLTGEGDPEELRGQSVTGDFFDLYGVRPALGSAFRAEDVSPDGPGVVVLSHELWATRFGSDRSVIGRGIYLNGQAVPVVGVMPPGFGDAQFWVPIRFGTAQIGPDARNSLRENWNALWLPVFGRLRDGVTHEQAQAEMTRIAIEISGEQPAAAEMGVLLEPLHDAIVGDARTSLILLLGAVVLVMMIACANIANLLLARSASKRAELSVRVALGAGRTALIRQVLVESLVLGLIGGVIGTAIAWLGTDTLVRLAAGSLPRLSEVRIDARILAFGLCASVAASLLFGLAPALAVARHPVGGQMRQTDRSTLRGSSGMRPALVVAQFALALMLLYSAGLLLRSFTHLLAEDRGLDPSNILVLDINLPGQRYSNNVVRREFYDQLLTRIEALPGVRSADAISTLLLSRLPNSGPISMENRPHASDMDANLPVARDAITPGLPTTLRMNLVRGRMLEEHDGPDAPVVALVNETFVRRFFADEDPLERRFAFGSGGDGANWIRIVGVLRDAERSAPGEPVMPYVFLPFAQMTPGRAQMVVRTQGDPITVLPHIRETLRGIDPAQPLSMARTLEHDLADRLAPRRFVLLLLATFAAAAVVLAGIGVYGVISYMVNLRTREFGLRMALGAEPRGVLLLVMRQAGRPVLLGMAVGAAGAFAGARLIRSQLVGVSDFDLVTQGGVVAVLAMVAVVSVWIPARRATGADPLVALRSD